MTYINVSIIMNLLVLGKLRMYEYNFFNTKNQYINLKHREANHWHTFSIYSGVISIIYSRLFDA